MRKIVLKELTMLNFKKIRQQTIKFNEDVTSISADNGVGKSTVFDAFTWLLFGKDSKNRKDFNVKTLDADGNAIPRIPHEVTATLQVDGQTITLCRKLNEKWQKKRGSAVEEYTGNEEERLFNDVPCSLKEWNAKIADICDEDVFKLITNPKYFTSLKADAQREMLLRMAGNISDEEIASGNEDFTALLGQLTGKTMNEYRKEIAAKKRRIKADADAIPGRIDERMRDIANLDYQSAEAELADLTARYAETEARLLDYSKSVEARMAEREDLVVALGKAKEDRLRIEYEMRGAAMEAYQQEKAKQQAMRRDVRALEDKVDMSRKMLKEYKEYLSVCSTKRENLIAEWRQINADTLTFSDKEFVCPTCGRRYEIEEIESKQQAMTEAFNKQKAERLADNSKRGKANKQKMEELTSLVAQQESAIEDSLNEIARIKADELYGKTIEEPTAGESEALRKQDEVIAQCAKALADFDAAPQAANDALKAEKSAISLRIDEVKKTLARREVDEANRKRIEELEGQYKALMQELAEQERTEYTIQEFCRAKNNILQERVNRLFSIVKFKLYEQLINGGEVETCVATVDGVPYGDLNTASKINAGLDIINAICRHEGISAPVFIDRAESVNEIMNTASQSVRLIVTKEKQLTIN